MVKLPSSHTRQLRFLTGTTLMRPSSTENAGKYTLQVRRRICLVNLTISIRLIEKISRLTDAALSAHGHLGLWSEAWNLKANLNAVCSLGKHMKGPTLLVVLKTG